MAVTILASYRITQDKADVLVCTTNSVGVMGAGVAKLFREQIPKLFYRYRKHCQSHNPKDMVPYVFDRGDGKYVYCLHTKRQWWNPSTMDYVEQGLKSFVAWCVEHEIKSIAIPPLGCGNGGLDFESEVKPVMLKYLEPLDAEVRIYHIERKKKA